MAGTTNDNASTKLERLESLVRRELAILGQVDALSQRQGSLVELEDSNPLFVLLAERQGLLEQVGDIAGEIAALREECSTTPGISAARWGAVQRDCEAVADLAERISIRDRSDIATMEQIREGVVADVAALGKGRGATAAYGTKRTESEPKYQDRHG